MHTRSWGRRALAAVALAAAATLAAASPAMPDPLEKQIEDADLVVVAKLRTKPKHSGDPFEVDVEEVLKGTAAPATLRVTAAHYFTSCLVSDDDPPDPAIEAKGDRAVLFLHRSEEDGAWSSRHPIVLAPEERASCWISGAFPAQLAPAAIRALVRLDAEEDTKRAAELWVEGLGSDNPLLVGCLLARVSLVAVAPGAGGWALGPRIAPAARTQFEHARTDLVRRVAGLVRAQNAGTREAAFEAATACLAEAGDVERALLAPVTAAAREAAVTTDRDVAREAVRFLIATDDSEVAKVVVEALRVRRGDTYAVDEALGMTSEWVKTRPHRKRDVTAALVLALDDGDAFAVPRALELVTGHFEAGAAAWRAWWAKGGK